MDILSTKYILRKFTYSNSINKYLKKKKWNEIKKKIYWKHIFINKENGIVYSEFLIEEFQCFPLEFCNSNHFPVIDVAENEFRKGRPDLPAMRIYRIFTKI